MINRRKALQILGITAGASLTARAESSTLNVKNYAMPAYTLCLNMATIRGHKLGFIRELETASAAGFHSVEIWIDSLQDYLNNGGNIPEVKKRLDHLGITVEDCISFNEWLVDDAVRRQKGLEQMKREMEMLALLGCKRIAATGKGTTEADVPNLGVIAERYHTVLELGASFGVIPQLEMWGFQKNMSNVPEVLYSAMQSKHPKAKILLDIFHLYRGNTALDTLALMNPNAADILHMNDYPAGFPWQTITDADRIYPGDGVAPIKRILKILFKDRKHPLILSTELFNKVYYQQDALTVAKTSMAKMKAVVEML